MSLERPEPNPGATTMLPRHVLNALGVGRRCLACGTKAGPFLLGARGALGRGTFCLGCARGGWVDPS